MNANVATLVPILIVLQAVTLVAVVGLALRLRHLRPPADPPSPELLARSLEKPFVRLLNELQTEHQRLRELAAEMQGLTELIDGVPAADASAATAPEVPKEDPSKRLAREEARRLLAADGDIADVAAATGLPDGEVLVLANLLKARDAVGREALKQSA